MDDNIDWEQFAAPEQSNQEFDWSQFREALQPEQRHVENATIIGEPEDFAQKMENFYRASGIHGANRGFAKIFGMGKHRENAEQKYQDALQTNPTATSIGNLAAQLYSSIPFAMAGGQVANAIPKLSAGAANYLGGAAGIGLQGALEHPEQDETRLGNAAKNTLAALTIPAIGKGVGMAAQQISKGAGKVVPNVGKSLTKGRVAENINRSFNQAKDKYTTLYEGLFKDARKAGVKTNLPSINVKRATKGIDEKTVRALKKALQTNNPKYVNQAQSKLGEFMRAEAKIKKSGGRIDQLAYENAEKLRDKLVKNLDTAFAKSNPDLAKRYSIIKSGYKKEVVPYSRNPAIQEYNAGDMVPKDLIAALRSRSKSGKLFRKHLSEMHPEVGINKALDYGVKGIIGSTGAGLLAGLGKDVYDFIAK